MTETLPDRLSNNPRSPFFKEEVLKRDIGVRFNGAEKTNVEEYCISEGWVRVEVGKTKDRFGNPMTIKLSGKVEPYFKDQKSEQPAEAETEQKPAEEKTAKAQQPAKADKPAKSDKAGRGAAAGKDKPGKTDTKPKAKKKKK